VDMAKPQKRPARHRPQHPRIDGCLASSPHGASSASRARAGRRDCQPPDTPAAGFRN
jgi:hypothetical protein